MSEMDSAALLWSFSVSQESSSLKEHFTHSVGRGSCLPKAWNGSYLCGGGNAQKRKCLSTNTVLKHKSSRAYNSFAARCNSLLSEAERQRSFSLGIVKP